MSTSSFPDLTTARRTRPRYGFRTLEEYLDDYLAKASPEERAAFEAYAAHYAAENARIYGDTTRIPEGQRAIQFECGAEAPHYIPSRPYEEGDSFGMITSTSERADDPGYTEFMTWLRNLPETGGSDPA